MAKRPPTTTAERKREKAAQYAAKAKDLAPFLTRKFPKKLSPSDRRQVTILHGQVFGGGPGSQRKPSLITADPQQRTVAAVTVKDPKRRAKLKRELGQQTSPRVKTVFIRRVPMPGMVDTYSGDPEVIMRKGASDIIINGWIVSIIEPIDPKAYAKHPINEESRAMAVLQAAWRDMAQHAYTEKGWTLDPKHTTFSPMCGAYEYVASGMHSPSDVKKTLQEWRVKYNMRENKRDRVAGFLTGIKMSVPFGSYGKEQLSEVRKSQTAKRLRRAQWRRRYYKG